MKSVYSAVRTGSLNKAVWVSSLKGLYQVSIKSICWFTRTHKAWWLQKPYRWIRYSESLLAGRYGVRNPATARFSLPVQSGVVAHLAYCTVGKVKGKAIPLQAWTGPVGPRRMRLPDFKTIGTWSGKVVSPRHRPLCPPGNIPGTHFYWRLNQPQGNSAAGRIMPMRNSSDTIGNRTRNLPTCRAVRQQTSPLRAPYSG